MGHDVFEYIELFYNGKCIHCVLGYISTEEYILTNCNQKAFYVYGGIKYIISIGDEIYGY